jgi:DNA ligase-1
MDVATNDQWNGFYRRILIKDLRCGVSEKTVNTVAKKAKKPQYAVPVFECMLAHDGANHQDKIEGEKFLQPKLDGVRCITVINKESETVVQYTRNGKVLENFSHITAAILEHLPSFEESLVLDGEIVSHSFQDLMKQVHRKSNVQAGDARLMLFDVIPLAEFRAGKGSKTQVERHQDLVSFTKVFESIGYLDVIPQVKVDLDSFIGREEYKDYNKKIVEQGFEGIMIKDPNAVYECKRSTAWLKEKPFIEVSLSVVAVEEGTGRNQGRLGALVCEGVDDGKRISVNVGSGFTDDARSEFWTAYLEKPDSVIGQVVEVRADAATRSQDSEDTWSLRFPRFLRFRGFAKGEKI